MTIANNTITQDPQKRKPALPDSLHERALEIANEAIFKFPGDAAAYLEAINIAAIEKAVAGQGVANRQVLPLNSGAARIKPGQIKPITSRGPQSRMSIRPSRMFVSGHRAPMTALVAPTPHVRAPWWRRLWNALVGRPSDLDNRIGYLSERIAHLVDFVIQLDDRANRSGAADWAIHDIRIRGRSQLAQSGAIPGDMFANNSIDSFVTFDRVNFGDEVIVMVEYIGPNKDGLPFYGSMICEADPEPNPEACGRRHAD